MPKGNQSKIGAFRMWLEGRTVTEMIQALPPDTQPRSIRQWVIEWERGRQRIWTPQVHDSN